jgi:hypothetical protein
MALYQTIEDDRRRPRIELDPDLEGLKEEDGDPVNEIPCRWAVCSQCDGTGTSSAYLGAFTREDMDEMGEEFMDEYMKGAYDRPCPVCKGKRLTAVPFEEEHMNPAQRAALKVYRELLEEERYMAAVYRAETGQY